MSKVKHLPKFSPFIQEFAAACDFGRVTDLASAVKEVTCKKCLHIISRDHIDPQSDPGALRIFKGDHF